MPESLPESLSGLLRARYVTQGCRERGESMSRPGCHSGGSPTGTAPLWGQPRGSWLWGMGDWGVATSLQLCLCFHAAPRELLSHEVTRGPQHSRLESPGGLEELVNVTDPSPGLNIPELKSPGANSRVLQHLVE